MAKNGPYCPAHDPALAEQRSAWGRRRHPRFVPKTVVDGQEFERAKVPTIAKLIDSLLDVAADVRSGALDPQQGNVVRQALRDGLQALQAERDWNSKPKGDSEPPDAGDELGNLEPSPMTTQ